MGLLCLPIHIWDRELDSRVILAALAANIGHEVLIGHEYNIAGLYKKVPNIYYLHNGRPTDSYRSKDWREPIKNNGGYTSLILEEGLNEQNDDAFIKQYVGVTNESIKLVDKLFCCTQLEYNAVGSFLSQRFSHFDIKSKLEICSNARFELLGDMGRLYFGERIQSLQTLFRNFVLISDNFGIEQFGGDKPLDQLPRYKGLLKDSEEIERLMNRGRLMYKKNLQVRDVFCKIINTLIHNFPDTLFIIRPHPVSDPRYWYNNIIPSRNSYIFYRDSIEPWIHASTCVLHSGCTVGLQAELASVPSIDISSLIQDDRSNNTAVSTKLASYKVSTMDELINSFKTVLSDQFKSKTLTQFSQIKEPAERLKCNQFTINKNIMGELNTKYGLPQISASKKYLDSVDKFLSLNTSPQQEQSFLKYLGNNQPNPNKSRLYTLREMQSRFTSAVQALNISSKIGIMKTNSINTYLIKRIN